MTALSCGAPPRRFDQGGKRWVETCNRPARRWNATKGEHTAEVIRCDEHAATLRRNGYDVRIAAEKPRGVRTWDMTTTNSLEAAAGWLRKQSDAVLVVVIRAQDAVVAVDEGIGVGDVCGILERCLPEALARLEPADAASVSG